MKSTLVFGILLQLARAVVVVAFPNLQITSRDKNCNSYRRRNSTTKTAEVGTWFSGLFTKSTTAIATRHQAKDENQCKTKTTSDQYDGSTLALLFDRRTSLLAFMTSSFALGTASTVAAASTPMESVPETQSQGISNDDNDGVSSRQQRMAFKNRPKAPTRFLVPVTQQRLLLEKCLKLSERLVLSTNDATALSQESSSAILDTLQELKSILIDPSSSTSDKNRNPYYTPNLKYQQRMERDQTILREYFDSKGSRQQLSGTVLLAAMNTYTDHLTYSPDYVVNDENWKKAYIRSNGGLPNVEQLVRADMDLRVMYRNQVQLRVDDASAEFYYYYKNNIRNNANDEIEQRQRYREFAIEFQQLVKSASVALNEWFAMIDDKDIEEALSILSTLER